MNEEKKPEAPVPVRTLFGALAALFCLTALTIWVAHQDTGAFRLVTALTIAAAKSCLVLLVFMRIRQAGRAVVTAFIITLLVLAAFIGLTFFDVLYRRI